MKSWESDDDRLPRAILKRRRSGAAAFVALTLMGMVVAAAAGGVDWLIGVGGAGTAVGTLGLAYFTFAVAERTTQLVGSSQRLEAAATGELSAARAQAEAAAATAREAQRARIDALAPILDFNVRFREARARVRGIAPSGHIVLVPGERQERNPNILSFDATLAVSLKNLGRTSAFASFRHVGATIPGLPTFVQIEPGRDVTFTASLDYPSSAANPFDSRELRFEIELYGPMSDGPIDQVTWIADLTLVEHEAGGWHLASEPLRIRDYQVSRQYTPFERDLSSGEPAGFSDH